MYARNYACGELNRAFESKAGTHLDTHMTHIVMLSGWLKSGKDTVGEYLCRRYGFKRLAFADALKDEVSATYGIRRDLLDSQQGKDTRVESFPIREGSLAPTVRDVLIHHGQWRRSQDLDYWVRKVQPRPGDRIVITDWRFPNEFEVLSQRCTVETWRVERWATPPRTDPSEVALDSHRFDLTLKNTGPVAELYSQIDAWLQRPDYRQNSCSVAVVRDAQSTPA